MSDIRAQIEAAIVDAIKGEAALAEVATVEASVRDCLFSGDKLTAGFRPEELPAIAISAQLKPCRKSPFSCSATQWEIPVTAIVVTRAAKGSVAMARAAEIQAAVDELIDSWRRSGNALGTNALVMGEASSSANTIDEKPISFGISTTEFTVLKVIER